MANAVVNSSGDVLYSKVVDASVTLTNNVLDSTNAVDDTTPADGKWTKGGANVVCTLYTINESEAGPVKNSTGVKIAVAAGFTTGLVAYGRMASADISAYDAVTFYIRSSEAIASGVLKFLICSDNAGATPVETLLMPAIPKTILTSDGATSTDADIDQWVRIVLRLNNPSSDTAIQSVAINAVSDPGTVNLYIHEIRLMKSFPGRLNFSLSETVDSIDTTDYQSLGAKEFEPSFSSWTCNFDGHKEGIPPLAKGKEYVFGIWESDTLGHCWVGNGFYSSFSPSGSVTETVKYPYSIQGKRYLSKPLA